MAIGAAFANDVRSKRILAIDAPPPVVSALRRQPWVIESEVDSINYFLADDGSQTVSNLRVPNSCTRAGIKARVCG
jgi:hypothetical protein